MAGSLKMEGGHTGHYPQPGYGLAGPGMAGMQPHMSSYLFGREGVGASSAYHSAMYSSLHDPSSFLGLHEMGAAGAASANYYGNMGYGYMSPYYRYMRQGVNVKTEMTCEWIDQAEKLKLYHTF